MRGTALPSFYLSMRGEVFDLIPNKPRHVLELGCGQGVFGRRIKEKYGSNVTGIELFDNAAKLAAEVLDKVYNESLETFDFSKLGQYDLIVANDVLEHLSDPWSVVHILKNHLMDDGVFMASIPNVQHHKVLTGLLKGNWEYTEAGILDKTHLRFFTKKSESELFTENGYKIQSIVAINIDKINRTNILQRIFKALKPDMYVLQFVIIAGK